MLLKSLLTLRLLQSPLSLIFLIAVSWTLYLTQNSPSTSSQPSHPFTTTLRFLAPIITLPYVCYELFRTFKVIRGQDAAGKYALGGKSRTFKIGRVFMEFALGGMWFFAFVLSLAAGSWSMTGDNRMLTSNLGSSSGSSDNSFGTNGTVTATTSGNATVIPAANSQSSGTNMFIVPPGGKLPMVLGSVMWLGLIGLFALSSLAVIVETARNWKAKKSGAKEQEMDGYGKGESV